MAFAVELEEWVGAHWHRFITRHASGEFEAARVTLESMRRPLGMLFRALGGAPGVALEATPARRLLLRRTWLQRVAGTCEQAPVSWFNGDSLRLPEALAVYPQAELNRELYRWLALLAASAGPLRHWAQDNQRWARQLLDAYPALRPRYARLVAAHLRQRPSLDDCPAADAELEIALRRALAEPGSVERFPRVERAPWPVPLWLYPGERWTPSASAEDGEEAAAGAGKRQVARSGARKRAERIEERDSERNLLLFRLESLLSWSEHLALDRCSDDEDDPDGARVAEDLDYLSLSRQRTQKGGGLRLDLDLPAADYDDLPLGPGLKLPEWDYRQQRLLSDHVLLQPMRPRRRDLACLLLADLSMSTEAYLDDQRRVIDSIVDSLLLFGEALQALGDPFALYGFSSVRRQQVRWQVLKDFDEGYGGEVRGRVLALSPGYYTRMGAAIRRASQVLGGQPQKRRLLLLLSDGKPNDLDRYEGRYGIEDTRQAVIEARSQGLVPFCITIDKEAADYLPYLFGADGFALVERAGQLPERLLQLYRRLRR
ncbi:nitric oxide reductase activation protein NorD [Pseudomonas aeruginosa]|nr:nitric oxide reductase activation protein NorD [Pseudomonas aeruginosa]